ncbi:MAG: helix-turn-helix domain-containing protein [Saprospiraceae bacterium]
MIGKGRAAAQKIQHANVLLTLDAGGSNWSDASAAEALGCSARTVFSIRQCVVAAGWEAALERKPRAHPPRKRMLDGDGEAPLVRIAGSAPPQGQARWTLTLLAASLIELQVVKTISPQTVMRTLKKRSETARANLLGDSARAPCRVRGRPGRRAGGLSLPR